MMQRYAFFFNKTKKTEKLLVFRRYITDCTIEINPMKLFT